MKVFYCQYQFNRVYETQQKEEDLVELLEQKFQFSEKCDSWATLHAEPYTFGSYLHFKQ